MRARVSFFLWSSLVIVICLVTLVVVWLSGKLTTPENETVYAAVYALDHTPMQKVDRVLWYTGGAKEATVIGTDAFDRTLYVFVRPNKMNTLYQNQAVTENQAVAVVSRASMPIAGIVSVVPGWNDAFIGPAAAYARPLWEVTARLRHGGYLFAFVDMQSGKLVWKYSSEQNFEPWGQE